MPFVDDFNVPSYEKVMDGVRLGFFDILHSGVSIVDKYGNFRYCNRAFAKMYGLPDNVVGRNMREFFPIAEESLENSPHERKMVISLDDSGSRVSGILFNYRIYDCGKKFCGMLIESIPCDLGREKLPDLLDSMHTLEMKSFSSHPRKKSRERDINTFSGMIGQSRAMREMRYLGQRFAFSDEPVLITGESGTGKELVARALHNDSERRRAPFITVNCAALPGSLIEAELFGYESGAFTGARAGGMKGKFEQANGGTIFLDEIGELPLAVQAKLLRVLENGEVQKIGCHSTLHSNFRMVGATNRDLAQMVLLGKFREDLYHRLCVFEINVPPLREREGDIFLLARFYLDQYLDGDKSVWLDPEMENIFRNYSWPGNIRELKNTLIYALYALGAGQNRMGVRHLPQRFLKSLRNAPPDLPPPVDETAQDQLPADEKQLLKTTLEKFRYNKALTARELGISRSKLYRMLHKYGLAD